MPGDLTELIAALLVLAVLTLIMRWVFKPSRRRVAIPADAAPGLLVPVAGSVRRSEGLAIRASLSDANIRSSLSAHRDGRVDVMVFRADAERARALLPPPI